MKKAIISLLFISLVSSAAIAVGGTYSDAYIKNMKTCTVHIEKYDAEIPTDDVNTPSLHLTSTETISGWQNGKCVTKSVVYSKELGQNILTTQCEFNEKQLASVVKKMEDSKTGDAKARQKLQEELTNYVKDNSICTVNNLLEK